MEKKMEMGFWEKISLQEKEKLYQLYRLLDIMKRLRSPGGCPWDKKQTHESLKPYLIEEAYEVLAELEQENIPGIQEELGDLLLQVVFHAQVAEEAETFSMKEVAQGISDKLVRRHPHIFGDVSAETSEEVLVHWNKIKEEEKRAAGIIDAKSSLLDQVNRQQPALMEAQKLQDKASRVGFDWDHIDGAIDKVEEEILEVKEAYASGNLEDVREEIGDLLFAVVNVARFIDECQSELALRQTSEKFRRRFRGIESLVNVNGERMEDLTLEILDGYWNQIKAEEKKK